MSIGEKIRTARKAVGISQEALAEKLEVSMQAVSTWERNENMPETKKLVVLAKELNVSLDYLLTEDADDWKMQLSHSGHVLDKAIAYAAAKHSGTPRKGTRTPYIVHPMEVAAIVSGLTDDEEVIAAAVLHDVLEDTGTSQQELEQAFGKRIAGLVADESENKREDQPPANTWKERKQETIEHLKNASHAARVIALGDKLANIRAMERDYEMLGDTLWERFNEKSKASHAWYYASILHTLDADPELKASPFLHEFGFRVYSVFWDIYDDSNEKKEEKPLIISCFYPDTVDAIRKKAPKGSKAWSLILDRTNDDDLKQLQFMAMIYDCFLRSESVGFADTHLVLTNDPDAETVTWEKLPDGYAIHLCAASAKHWAQVGFQMGYAMMHCLIDHLNPNHPAITWAEELICEAGTLALLSMLAEHWDETPFGKEDPDYVQYIPEYIDANLSDKGTAALIRCPDRETLQQLNDRNLFDDRINESHDLFSKIEEGDLLRLAQVRDYAADELLLYTHYWRGKSEGSQAVEYICRLQEQIPGCELPAGVFIDINLENSRPTAEQRTLYAGMIRCMKDLPEEALYFDFLDDKKKDCEQIGLVFYRVSREKSGQILAGIRLDTKTGRKLYRLYCNDDRAVSMLNDILDGHKVPDLTDWEDITESIFQKEKEGESA